MEALLQNQVIKAISVALDKVKESGELSIATIPAIFVEPPKRPEWGDFSSNVAMTLASQVRQSPLKVAGVLATGGVRLILFEGFRLHEVIEFAVVV